MNFLTKTMVVVSGAFLLTACSSMNSFFSSPASTKPTPPANSLDQPLATRAANGGPLGGNLASGMDEIDKGKLAHALDKAPGTETKWNNAVTGIAYAATPIKKITLSGFQFCRNYKVVAIKGGTPEEFTGNACIGNSGTWEGV